MVLVVGGYQTAYVLTAGFKSDVEKLIDQPPAFVVKIDKRKTLGNLKQILSERIGIDPLYFKARNH